MGHGTLFFKICSEDSVQQDFTLPPICSILSSRILIVSIPKMTTSATAVMKMAKSTTTNQFSLCILIEISAHEQNSQMVPPPQTAPSPEAYKGSRKDLL